MLNRDVILTEYRADARNFQRGAKIYDRTLEKQHRLTRDRLGRIDARWERSTRSILASRTALAGLSGVVGGAAIAQLRSYAEGWRDVERRMQSIGKTSDEAHKQMVLLAMRTRGTLDGTASAVQRMAKSTGAGFDETIRRVETFQKLLASAGASGTESSALSLQLGQALQSGVLSGDEFRTIREAAPVEFLDALAKAAGVTRRELKKTAEGQKLTTDIVLRALDGLASAADEKFTALEMSGSEAFNVLSTGLTVYVGSLDDALGATSTFNKSVAWLGEYLSESSEGAETLAQAIKIVGAIALTTAGSRGIGALNTALDRNKQAARAVVFEAQKEVAASRQRVTAAHAELAASKAIIAQKQAELVARMQANQKLTKAVNGLNRAKERSAKAASALVGAESRAALATERLTLATSRLSLATRAFAKSVQIARSTLAFFGGPLGLALTAFTTLPLLIGSTDNKMADLREASDRAMQAMNQFAEASKKAGEEQEGLGGKVTKATQAILAQSRVKLQDELKELNEQRSALLDDIQGVGIFNRSDIAGPVDYLRGELKRLYTQYGGENTFLSDVIEGLNDLQAGTANLQQLSKAMNEVRAVGEEGFQKYLRFTAAFGTDDIEAAQQDLLSYAEAVGIFQDQIRSIEDAKTPDDLRFAFETLAQQIYDAAVASREFGHETVKGLAESVRHMALLELKTDLLEALLANNNDEAERLAALLEEATGEAVTLGGTDLSDPITRAADEAERLAENLALSRGKNLDAQTGHNPEFFDPRNESGNSGRVFRDRDVPAENRPGYKPPNPEARSVAVAERDLSDAREILLTTGRKSLYIEQQLNAERARLRDLLPDLVKMGLSRAEAEVILNDELSRSEEALNKIKTASEEAAASFAKSMLQDIRSAENLTDALGKISDRLLDLAYDRAFDLLADQFANLAGGQDNVFGTFLSALLGTGAASGGATVKAATGGLIRGPGGPTSDSIPARLSDGEFVVRAKSVTPETLPFLEVINRGAVVPKFSAGGMVGRSGQGAAAGGSGPLMQVEIHNHASNARVEAQPSQDGRGLKVLIWDTVSEGIVGGRFDRPNQAAYGLKRKARGN